MISIVFLWALSRTYAPLGSVAGQAWPQNPTRMSCISNLVVGFLEEEWPLQEDEWCCLEEEWLRQENEWFRVDLNHRRRQHNKEASLRLAPDKT